MAKILQEQQWISAGDIFGIFEQIAATVEGIRCDDREHHQYSVLLPAGTIVYETMLNVLDGIVETDAQRAVQYYRTSPTAETFLRVSHSRDVLQAELVTLEDMADDLDYVPEEFYVR
jgi:hypothetical protein